MANFHVTGLESLASAFKTYANVPEAVKEDILTAMGDATKRAIAQSAENEGIVDSGKTVESLTRGKPRVSEDGGSVKVTFAGTRTDKNHAKPTRNAEVAFINEFGKKKQKARPFVKNGIERNAAKIVAAGEEVYREWQDKV